MIIRKSRKGAVFAGTEIVLTIGISFSNNSFVDVDIVFVIEWSREGNVIVNDDRIKISSVNNLGRASLTYSPIATSDSGLITANVTASPSDDSMYIQSVTATSFHNLTISGELSICMHYVKWNMLKYHNLLFGEFSVIPHALNPHVLWYNYNYTCM